MNILNLRKDHYYSNLYDKYGEEYIREAGYFDHDDYFTSLSDEEINETLFVTTTPLPLLGDVKLAKNPVILLNAGCYNPIHGGHLMMMDRAKDYMKNKLDMDVVGCYYAPAHDSYVIEKSPNNYLNIHERISLILERLTNNSGSNTHFVDTWACLYLKNDVNFTTVYRRLELYIEKYLGIEIPIYYVCGSDRVNFVSTFNNKTIVVPRTHEFKNVNDQVKHVTKIGYGISSTDYRLNYKLDKFRPKKKNLYIRDIGTPNIGERLILLGKQFNEIIASSFSREREIYNNYKVDKNIISLDKYFSGSHNFEVSRYYLMGGVNSLGIGSRNGINISDQICSIDKSKSYFLFDDDTSVNGTTLNYVKNLLKESGVIINGSFTFVTRNDECEVLDYEDFYIGENSGLQIVMPNGEKVRMPYLYPFVNITERASIFDDPLKFSKQIWKIIKSEVHENVCVSSLERYKFLELVGFNKNDSVKECIQKIINIL